MNIIPIATTQINWVALTKGSERFIGVSPTRNLDDNKITVGPPESYLSTLTCFKNNLNDPKNIEDFALKHVNISLLIDIDKSLYTHLLEYMYHDTLIIRTDNFNNGEDVVFIATTTLFQWREYCYTLKYSYKMKEFSYNIYEILNKFGYKNIFDEYKITEHLDGSKQLERR